MKGKFILYGIVALIAIGVGLFTVSSKEVVRYNDATIEVLKQMNASFNSYGTRIKKYCEGKKADPAALEQEITKIDTAIKQAREKMSALKVPDDDICRAFHKELTSYIDTSETANVQNRKINEYVAAHAQPEQADILQVAQLLKPSVDAEEKAMKSLCSVQAEMAKKYKLKLQ